MSDVFYLVGILVAMTAVTFLIRAMPFVASDWLRRQSWVKPLGEFLPLAIMVLLVLHGAAGSAAGYSDGGWFEGLAIATTVLLQWRYRNALLSIFAGGIVYVVLRNALWISFLA